jgi:hypothetical protein
MRASSSGILVASAAKANRRSELPNFVVKELLRGHKCLCVDCAPGLKQDMYNRARNDILQDEDFKAKLREELSAEIRDENRKRLEEQWRNMQAAMS